MQVSIALRIRPNTAGQQHNTFYSQSAPLPFNRSATQYKSGHIKSQLNRNWNTRQNAGAISPQYSSRTASPMYSLYFSRTASDTRPWTGKARRGIEIIGKAWSQYSSSPHRSQYLHVYTSLINCIIYILHTSCLQWLPQDCEVRQRSNF